MIIEVITAFYREEFLAPLFFLHYSPWCDRMTFITQQLTDGKFDDEDKSNWINEAVRRSTADWVVLVDMDEFVYPTPYGINPRTVLEQEQGSVIYSHMTRMWRHHTDKNIDRTLPPVPQRLHGQLDHVKPAIFRPHRSIQLGAGNHDIHADHPLKHGTPWVGAHWANADPCFWLDRETRDRGPRLSDRNVSRGHGTHTRRSREQILQECRDHENDTVIINIP
jgi:hypothetical protein